MNSVDLTPLYRSSIGFDRLASLIDSALASETTASGYPHYNIEMLDESRFDDIRPYNDDEVVDILHKLINECEKNNEDTKES